MMKATVTVECIGCHAKREIGPGDIPKNEVPLCDKCGMPMVAIGATVKRGKRNAKRS